MQDIWLHKSGTNLSVIGTQLTTYPRALDLRHFVKRVSHGRSQFCGLYQQDAHEFLTHLITKIHEELQSPSTNVVKLLSGTDIRYIPFYIIGILYIHTTLYWVNCTFVGWATTYAIVESFTSV